MAVYEINVQKAFTASHSVSLPGGTAEPSHEHKWMVTATFRSNRLDETMGAVIDFRAVDDALEQVTGPMDGTDLNSAGVLADGRASAERVAQFIAVGLAAALVDQLGPPGGDRAWLRCVNVTEAPGCSASYYADANQT